jgi:hypothetical protein
VTKSELLQQVKEAIKNDQVTYQEVVQAANKESYSENREDPSSQEQKGGSLLFRVLGYVGILGVVLGVAFVVSELWSDLSDAAKILWTLGVGGLAYMLGTILMKVFSERSMGLSVHLLAAILIPSGWLVTFNVLGGWTGGVWLPFGVFLITAIVYIWTSRFLRSNLFTAFTIIFASIAYGLGIAGLGNELNSWGYLTNEWFVRIGLFLAGLLYVSPLVILSRLSQDRVRRPLFSFFEGVGYIVFYITTTFLNLNADSFDVLNMIPILVYLLGSVSLRVSFRF